jgi:hypothetical protein
MSATKNENGGITYQHIPQAGKTIATLEGCGNNLENIIWKLVLNNSRYLGFIGINSYDSKELMMSDRYRGIAKVNTEEGDVYDEAEGNTVAYKKVMHKYHKNLDSRLRMFLTDVRGLLAGIEHYLDKKGVDYSKVPSVDELKKSRFFIK